jgi:hypothetical protein
MTKPKNRVDNMHEMLLAIHEGKAAIRVLDASDSICDLCQKEIKNIPHYNAERLIEVSFYSGNGTKTLKTYQISEACLYINMIRNPSYGIHYCALKKKTRY